MIGIKYCGGCNPRYERSELVERMKRDYPSFLLEMAEEGKEYDLVVIVCGCPSKCADHTKLLGRYGKIMIAAMEDYHYFIEAVDSVLARH